jgi:hypothetical protein
LVSYHSETFIFKAFLQFTQVIAHPELFQSLILTTPAGLSNFGENYSRSFFAQLVNGYDK